MPYSCMQTKQQKLTKSTKLNCLPPDLESRPSTFVTFAIFCAAPQRVGWIPTNFANRSPLRTAWFSHISGPISAGQSSPVQLSPTQSNQSNPVQPVQPSPTRFACGNDAGRRVENAERRRLRLRLRLRLGMGMGILRPPNPYGNAALTVPRPSCYFAPEFSGYELFP
jgi:hypothetical protein